jgi:hypothetical protein
MLERLSYTSKETEPFGTRDLFDLLNHARQKNSRLRLTGHLLYAHGVFTQCIEGPTEALNSLWAALLKDPRHHDIQLLDRSPIGHRSFADWSMAFSSYRYLNAFNMPGFFPIDEGGASPQSLMCKGETGQALPS